MVSVCEGLCHGFFPWATTTKEGYLSIKDESKVNLGDNEKIELLKGQHDLEVAKGRFSAPFGRSLLPGMYSMPIYAVPKPNSTDFCLVTDQSRGKHSLNSMIEHSKVTGYPLDNMVHFGEMLMNLENKQPGKIRVAWKSDVAEAYRIIPMHPRWQIKQVNVVDGELHIDCCNAFGGCASGALFIAFNSLVTWTAKKKKGVRYLGTYVDDSSGCGLEDDFLFYEPYQKAYPRDQTILMMLWDELGVPHKKHKQVFGRTLLVIEINVDANALTFTLTQEAKEKLIKELLWWCKPGRKEKLKRWYQMGGWFNWALNVYPHLRPALNHFYPKIKGRCDSTSLIWVNNNIRTDFLWAIKILSNSVEVRLLKSIYWEVENSTLEVYCDACPEGMGFWYPALNIGYYSPTPTYENPDLIFYFEALCVLSALHDAHHHTPSKGNG